MTESTSDDALPVIIVPAGGVPVVGLNPPTWQWNFLNGTIPAGATFSRASSGTYFDANGVLQSAALNVPRFDHDPVTGVPYGYLSEMQTTNVVLFSGDASNAAWTKQSVTVTGAQVTAPDGTLSGAKMVEGTGQVSPEVYQNSGAAANAIFGVSAFSKAGTRSAAYLNIQAGSGNYVTAVFDLVAGTVGETTTGTTSGTLVSANIRNVGNGWYRISMIVSVAANGSLVVFGMSDRATGNTFNAGGECVYTGDGASYVYLWGMQSESIGGGVTSYIPTTTAAVTRAADALYLPLSSLPGWDPNAGGVVVATHRTYIFTVNQQKVLQIDDTVSNTNNVILENWNGGSSRRSATVFANSVLDYGIASPHPENLTPFQRTKLALGWDAKHGALAADGSLLGTADNAAGTLPINMTRFWIGNSASGAVPDAAIENIAYYAVARSDAFVVQVSR